MLSCATPDKSWTCRSSRSHSTGSDHSQTPVFPHFSRSADSHKMLSHRSSHYGSCCNESDEISASSFECAAVNMVHIRGRAVTICTSVLSRKHNLPPAGSGTMFQDETRHESDDLLRRTSVNTTSSLGSLPTGKLPTIPISYSEMAGVGLVRERANSSKIARSASEPADMSNVQAQRASIKLSNSQVVLNKVLARRICTQMVLLALPPFLLLGAAIVVVLSTANKIDMHNKIAISCVGAICLSSMVTCIYLYVQQRNPDSYARRWSSAATVQSNHFTNNVL